MAGKNAIEQFRKEMIMTATFRDAHHPKSRRLGAWYLLWLLNDFYLVHIQIIPAYEPLHFPLNDMSLQRMKRLMPSSHLHQIERYFSSPLLLLQNVMYKTGSQQSSSKNNPIRPQRKRKHNDSISESKLIKEKLPSSSLLTLGRSNLLIPRNSQNILENIDLIASNDVVIKQLINNNNISNNGSFEVEESEDALCDSDSETVTGDESVFDDSEPQD